MKSLKLLESGVDGGGLLHYNHDDPKSFDQNMIKLTRRHVRTIDRSGGTFLHTSRTNPGKVQPDDMPDFLKASQFPITKGDDKKIRDCTSHILKNLEHLGIDALIAIGGDDTLSYAARLNEENFPIIAVPKTMDNDVFGTDYCIGFGTAVTRSVGFIHQLRTSIGSHERIGVIELFGRYCGEVTLISSYLAGVDRALISEVPFDPKHLAELILKDKAANKSHYAIVTIAEGAHMIDGEIKKYGTADAYGHYKLGGIGQITGQVLRDLTKQDIIYQCIAYLMRSGAPDAIDLMVAVNFATTAVNLIKNKSYGRMVALRDGTYTHIPISTMIQGTKRVDVGELYDKEQYRPKVRHVLGKPMFLY